ncbi:hypothetical protein HYH02_000725 [Chlamydomonas schloesseri]|uniref:3-hydroxyisobutyryl-CoA hydrolase n=1 Tax=Chlamydomonas schloesseri TaxID=2026947 RepID=A0A835WWT8_9CHLO|nr:hypothetical protein HYH02_000725 [Chlamydomonas schloesseri]|eukprot:KAG2454894.1 hypothetical protein HYH02_000725 [Chlamydomonas schloesseri]
MHTRGYCAVITLNRPHALDLAALRRLESFHAEVAAQTCAGAPMCVLVRRTAAAGKAAASAEADDDGHCCHHTELVRRARAGDPGHAAALKRAQYGTAAAISRIAAPYVVLMDGPVSGGGGMMGVAVPSTLRVATERTVVALPEVALGLFPDAGATSLLQRLPGALGRWLGLTGLALTGAEVRDAGIATHLLPSACLPELEAALAALGPRAADRAAVEHVLTSFEGRWKQQQQQQQQAGSSSGSSSGSASLRWKLSLINEHFGRGSLEEVVASLDAAVAAQAHMGARAEQAAFLRDTLNALRRGSPLSQAVTWELLRRAAGQLPAGCATAAAAAAAGPAAAAAAGLLPIPGAMGINSCNGELLDGSSINGATGSSSSSGSSSKSLLQVLEMEYVAACRCMAGQGDYYEGVRAGLIDRDGWPAWRYGSVAAVPAAAVHAMFEPLPGQPLLAPQVQRDWGVGAYPQWPVWCVSRL